MTDEERQSHERWQRTHKPGPGAERKAARARRATALDIAELMARPEPPAPADVAEMQQMLDATAARLKELDAAIAAVNDDDEDLGVFG